MKESGGLGRAGGVAYHRMQWVGSLAIAAIAIMLLPAAATSQPAERAPKWTPHIDVEGKTGTKRNLGEADLFVPLAQDGTTLLFSSLRTRMDDSDGLEGNFGLGLRHMLESGWNLGAYAYFDRRKSELENYFSQVTLGLEALSLDWDLRANAYLPQGRRSHQVDALNTAEVSGTNVIFRGGGDTEGHSDALLGIFDAIAPAASAALGALARKDVKTFHDILAPTVPLSRHIFRAPTRF